MYQYNDKVSSGYTDKGMEEMFHRKYILYPSWLKKIGNISGLRVLDIGCGDGRSSRLLAKNGAIVTGVDNSKFMLDIAKQKEKLSTLGIEYIYGDVGCMSLINKGNYDLIIGAMILHYAKTESELNNYALNISKNLKLGGRLVLINQNPDHPVQEYHPFINFSTNIIGNEIINGSQIKVTLHNIINNEVTEFINYYWSKDAYFNALTLAGFKNITWNNCHISEEGKRIFNEKEVGLTIEQVEKMMVLAILSADKK
ncbi:MAG: methyltransferase domain-containing protein [Candidatus Buchananbacteria bacterium]